MLRRVQERRAELKILCKRQDLSRGLATVSHAVSTRSTLPVLANLLITTESDQLRLSATNLEVAITCRVPAKIDEEGTTTVPAKLIGDFVNALSAGDVELISLPGGAPGLRVRSGSSEANIRGMDPGEFPAIPQVEGLNAPLKLDAGELRGMIGQTTFAAATDDARPIFTGILTRVRDGKLTFAAADTFRLAVRTTTMTSDEQTEDLLIPARTLNELAKILPTEGTVELFAGSARNQVVFRAPSVEMVSHLIDGQFPKYEAILPKSHTTRVVMPTDQLRNAAKVAALFARNESASNTVQVTVTPGQEGLMPGVVTLQATNDELGDATGTVDATVDGPEVSILFNIKYLSEVLGVISTPEVILELNTSQQPGVIKPMGNDDYVYVIMPLYSRG
jgi:DNA polymerase III subunit beta